MKRIMKKTAMLLVGLWILLGQPNSIQAQQQDYQNYVTILYNSENGMPTSEANDIVQTSDGFIWIASYSGLIRYDGDTFERITDTDGVTSANTLLVDSKDQLWIGTNDNGLMRYHLGVYKTYNKADGMASNSVKTIEEDSKGNLYIGTTAGVYYLEQATEQIYAISLPDSSDAYINHCAILPDDTLLCVTNNQNAYVIKDQNASAMELPKEITDGSLTSVDRVSDGWYFGTEGNKVYHCIGTVDSYTCQTIDCQMLSRINCVEKISDDTTWICSDAGVGYLDNEGRLTVLEDYQLNNSVDNMLQDFEGNLWFSSSRQGVFKGTPNYFNDLSKKASLEDLVVNSITLYQNQIYAATDTGLVIVDAQENEITNDLTEYLKKVRIRCLLVDDSENLWLCTYGDTGLICWDGKTIKRIGQEQGLQAGKLRSVIQSKDGSMIVATANGIYWVKEKKVISYMGIEEGLTNLEILSLYEAEDGTLYAGTDGGGVCLIRDGKVIDTITEVNGLRSGIVMRIRYDRQYDGYWLITSNSIAFYKDGKAKSIEKFPYSNNYDLYFGVDDKLWILSSNGIYVVQEESMFGDDALRYSFYNYNSGMPSTPTSNSFSFLDEKSNTLYVCGSTGFYSIQTDLSQEAVTAKLAIPYITADGEVLWNSGEVIQVPEHAKRIQIDAYALSYGLENPLIAYRLEGFEKEKIIVRKSEMQNIIYTNLSGGDYTFHFSVINPTTGEELASSTIAFHKKLQLWEQPWFLPALLAGITAALLAVAYIIMKFRMNRFVIRQEEDQKQKLSDALKQAESASMAKGSFLSNMSHEIRTPLNAVIGYLSIASDAGQNMNKMHHCLDNAQIAARHLLQIINDVLDMSSIESGKLKIAKEEFDLKKEISDITTIFYQNSKNKKVVFDTQIEHLTEEWVIGDQLRLNQVLMNLLSNAVKFTPENGNVSLLVKQLRVDEENVYVQFQVSDTGIGMSEEYKERLFRPFEQEDASTAKKYGGSGLGLSITHNLIVMMGGTIDVDSTRGKGTTFTVTMHFGRSEKHASMNALKMDYSKVRALVVDDQKNEGTYIKTVLKQCGVKADTVTSGEMACKRIQSRMGGDYEYNLCILDWKMPGMNGVETAEKIRRQFGSEIPIIVATAYDVSEIEEEAKMAGVDKVVSKPLFASTLFDLLVNTFGKYQLGATEEETSALDLSGIHILLTEDNEMNMEIAVTVLEKAGVLVDQAVNGQEACDRFEKAPAGTYQMILMDIQMPVMNGYDACRKIRSMDHPEAKTIPIIAMTANAFAEDVAQALSNGMNAHIAKPINYDKLFQLLKKFAVGKESEDRL